MNNDLVFFVYKRYAVVSSYNGNEKFLVIPEYHEGVPVREVRDRAFADNPSVEAVFIPRTLTSIGDSAFENTPLKYIGCYLDTGEKQIYPSGADDMPEGFNVDDLPAMSIFPPATKTIGSKAFDTTCIRKLQFRSSSVKIGEKAFQYCSHLETVLFHASELILGPGAFKNSSIRQLYSPSVAKLELPAQCFEYCRKLKGILAQIKTIGDRCFYNCEELRILELPQKNRIGEDAFYGCKHYTAYSESVPVPPAETPPESVNNNAQITLQPTEDITMDTSILFKTTIKQKGLPKNLPTELSGLWQGFDENYVFWIQSPAALSTVELQVKKSEDLLDPILEYLSSKHIHCALTGYEKDGIYYVTGMTPSDKKATSMPLSNKVYKKALHYCMSHHSRSSAPHIPESILQTDEELDTYFEMVQTRLPNWVVEAYHRNRAIVRQNPLRDASKHARETIRILLNVDWEPQFFQNIPPASEFQKILDEEIYGQPELKNELIEIRSVLERSSVPKYGLLLVGPPGVCKTSIAKALGRFFQLPLIELDFSLAGKDREPIIGSGRVFDNASLGLLGQKIYNKRVCGGTLLLNEVDKVDASLSDILLSMIDKTSGVWNPFLEEYIPMQHFFVIGTANDTLKMSKPLLDRFIVLNVPGYNPREKTELFRFLLPNVSKQYNMDPETIQLADDALDLLIDSYCTEAGARDIEKAIEKLVRHSSNHQWQKHLYTKEEIRTLFGPTKTIHRHFVSHPGLVNFAYVSDGKVRCSPIEATFTPGTGQLHVRGPIQSQASFVEVAYLAAKSAFPREDFKKVDCTVFCPDEIASSSQNVLGLPSYMAIVSGMTKIELARNDIVFWGGIDLFGNVYVDSPEVRTLARARGIHTIFVPLGSSELVDAKDACVTIVEAPDAKTLLGLAAAQRHSQE